MRLTLGAGVVSKPASLNKPSLGFLLFLLLRFLLLHFPSPSLEVPAPCHMPCGAYALTISVKPLLTLAGDDDGCDGMGFYYYSLSTPSVRSWQRAQCQNVFSYIDIEAVFLHRSR